MVKNLRFLGADGTILTAGRSGKVPPGQLNGTSTGTAETFQYFFHPDHLGSTSYITDASGEVYQHLEYIAFGETFVEEHSNTDRTPYLFNGKELDEETGLYYYGARYYDPRTSIWQSVDPLAEKMPGWAPYSFSFGGPVKFIDPDGREPFDVVLKGKEAKAAFAQLQASVQKNLTLSMDNNGKVTYTQNGNGKLSRDERQLVNAINDKSIVVNLNAENTNTTKSGNLYIGGAFSGNTVTQGVNGNTVVAEQEVNPGVLGTMSTAHGKPGADMLHEVTEACQGGLISQKSGKSSPASNTPNSVYPTAHSRATSQSGQIFETLFDASNKVLQMNPNGSYPTGLKRVEWSVKDQKGNNIIIQTLK